MGEDYKGVTNLADCLLIVCKKIDVAFFILIKELSRLTKYFPYHRPLLTFKDSMRNRAYLVIN